MNKPWSIRASTMSRNTQNLIRNIVEKIQVKPNPNKNFIPLSIGDPTAFGNLTPPEELLQAVRNSLDENESRCYGLTNGALVARQAVAEYYAHQGQVSADDVILCNGCAQALDLAITVLAEPGQNILVPRPGYMLYRTIAEGLGIVIKHYNLLPEKNWEVDLKNLEDQIDDKTAALIVLNPSNPCGSVYTKEHLRDILRISAKHRLPIIADEIYEKFVIFDNKFTSLASISKDVPILVCSGLTKGFLVPGWRMGWLVIHDRQDIFSKDIRDGLRNLTGRLLGPNKLIQMALSKTLTTVPQSFFDSVMSFIESQAKLAYKELSHAPGLRPILPQGAMYMMIEIKMSMFPVFRDELEFIERMYSEQSILCIPGQCFDFPNFMRIVLTVPEHILREACARIQQFCRDHIMQENNIN
ncbi:tyrosine aminotransferase-like [Galleria mellonella]|uniref:Tyrosine aminotransferase n=1 Tax=Galleria mellonella TaxID=7137 RepID=A0ABM3MEU1_GALME|nr:tyrosine aminotransferase-like [Galleria mellonella]